MIVYKGKTRNCRRNRFKVALFSCRFINQCLLVLLVTFVPHVVHVHLPQIGRHFLSQHVIQTLLEFGLIVDSPQALDLLSQLLNLDLELLYPQLCLLLKLLYPLNLDLKLLSPQLCPLRQPPLRACPAQRPSHPVAWCPETPRAGQRP